jgi:hypothetical protein
LPDFVRESSIADEQAAKTFTFLSSGPHQVSDFPRGILLCQGIFTRGSRKDTLILMEAAGNAGGGVFWSAQTSSRFARIFENFNCIRTQSSPQ